MKTTKMKCVVPGPAGQLEAALSSVEGATPRAVALVCHPHPQFGGTMDNKVVTTLAKTLNALNVPVLRLNFRGVGDSQGDYAEGIGEVDDALAGLDWLAERYPNTPLWLAGFSFGGGVAVQAAMQRPVARLITVAPSFATVPEAISAPTCPWLVLHGDADDVVPFADTAASIAQLGAEPEVKLFAGVGHFFHGNLLPLGEAVSDWLGDEGASN